MVSPFQPQGDQPEAIASLVEGVEQHHQHQVLLGVTGSGKTFTMANIIARTQLPTLIIAHNKTLAAQLYQEFHEFFPQNAVSYFVSYYDYYQPEAYIPSSDTYIEKEATINDEIDKLRLATTTNLLTRPDVIVIASVSCIYNLGSPVEYGRYLLELIEGEQIAQRTLLEKLAQLQYERSDAELRRGTYRLRGDTLQIWPAYQDTALTIETLEDKITTITPIDPLTGKATEPPSNRARRFILYPAKHYVIDPVSQEEALEQIQTDLEKQVAELQNRGRVLEAYRLQQRVRYDTEMIKEFGFVNGIENYSRYFDGRQSGQPPYTLLDYFKESGKQFADGRFLTFVDESHITLPQVKGMYQGDRSRKETLIEYGFRLPSAKDNRPLQFHEFMQRLDSVVYVSATPQSYEISLAQGRVVEQVVRPTGLLDPEVEIRPTRHQIDNLVREVIVRKQRGQRTLVTTLTKRMAEALTEYLNDEEKIRKLIPDEIDSLQLPKVAYLHSDVETLDRTDILADLRRGVYDVVVGINLLREGLDLPEVTLVAILDADKEGFLRSATSLIQTMGRAARHSEGRVILYADKITNSMQAAIDETNRRRQVQIAFNAEHHLTPTTISKPIREQLIERTATDQPTRGARPSKTQTKVALTAKKTVILEDIDPEALTPAQRKQLSSQLNRKMKQAVQVMDFEQAALLRDTIRGLEKAGQT